MSTPLWRKSSRSLGQDNSNCVEFALLPGAIGVRDSKNPNGPHLSMTADAFASLLANVKTNKLDR